MPSDSASGYRLDISSVRTSPAEGREQTHTDLIIDVSVAETGGGGGGGTTGTTIWGPIQVPLIGFPSGPSATPRRVEFTPENIGQVQNRLSGVVDNVTSEISLDGGGSDAIGNINAITSIISATTPISIPGIPSSGGFGGGGGGQFDVSVPRPLRNIASLDVGDVPFEGSKNIEYRNVRIPTIGGDFPDIPDISIQAELILDGADENPTVTFDISPASVFDPVRVSDLVGCEEIYPNIRDDIQNLENRIEDIRDQVPSRRGGFGSSQRRQQALSNIQSSINLASLGQSFNVRDARDRLDNVISDIPLPECRNNLRGRLNDVPDIPEIPELQSCADATDFYNRIEREINEVESEVGNLEDRVSGQNITQGSDAAENIRQTLRELNVEDVGTGSQLPGIQRSASFPSVEGIQNEIDDIRDNASQRERQCLQQLESRLGGIESRISSLENFEVSRPDTQVQRPQRPEILDCGDIPGNLNSQARSFVQDVRNRTGPGTVLRPREVQNIVNEANNLRDEINNRAQDRNPCKQELLSNVTGAIEDARASEADSCSELYPELDNRVDNIETGIVQLGGGVSTPEINQIRQEANSLIDDMEQQISNEDRECLDFFTRRIESSLDRLGQEVQSIRILESIGREAQQRQQQEIEQLQEQLAGIRSRAGGVLDEIEQAR